MWLACPQKRIKILNVDSWSIGGLPETAYSGVDIYEGTVLIGVTAPIIKSIKER